MRHDEYRRKMTNNNSVHDEQDMTEDESNDRDEDTDGGK